MNRLFGILKFEPPPIYAASLGIKGLVYSKKIIKIIKIIIIIIINDFPKHYGQFPTQ